MKQEKNSTTKTTKDIIQKTITETLDTDYREYALYTLSSRAIPCYIDGFKRVQKKILYAMLKEFSKGRAKVSEVGSSIVKYGYHHGESSAMGAVITLAANYDNLVPIFNQHGAFGTRLIPEAAAPRYIFVSMNNDFYHYFSDFDVLDYDDTDEDSPEPKTYLPNIPWLLVNGIKGIAVGFATNILSHTPRDIAKLCLKYLEGKNIDKDILVPTFPDFNGEVTTEAHNKFLTRGIINKLSDKEWLISELPVGYTREKYFNILVKLQESGKIKDFDDLCSDTFRFSIKTDKTLSQQIEKDPIKYFRLESAFTENYTTLDENNQIKLFDKKADIIKSFVDYRLVKINQQLEYDRKKLSDKIIFDETKIKFIRDVLDGKIDLRKLTKQELVSYITDNITKDEDLIQHLIRVPLYHMTTDAINAYLDNITENKTGLQGLNSTTSDSIYKERLNKIIKSTK